MVSCFRGWLLAPAVFAFSCGRTLPSADAPVADSSGVFVTDSQLPDNLPTDAAVLDDASPPDGTAPACTDNSTCPTGAYCAGNGCGTPGHCTTRPPMCTTSTSPVCGCDGHTYANPCVAAMEAVRVDTPGGCTSSPDAGPGPCTDNSSCALDELCDADACGSPGTCTLRPTACPTVYTPVCGCDGHTYANVCTARASGVRAGTRGACNDAGASLDAGLYPDTGAGSIGDADVGPCVTNGDCGPSGYCAGSACGGPGVCALRPVTCPMIRVPVCGCDGSAYDNACVAATAGIRLGAPGGCSAWDAGRRD